MVLNDDSSSVYTTSDEFVEVSAQELWDLMETNLQENERKAFERKEPPSKFQGLGKFRSVARRDRFAGLSLRDVWKSKL